MRFVRSVDGGQSEADVPVSETVGETVEGLRQSAGSCNHTYAAGKGFLRS